MMQTPGTDLREQRDLPSSVIEAATAVPAFVGWTEGAGHPGHPPHLEPRRITSMADYRAHFGGPPTAEHVRFSLCAPAGGTPPGDPAEPLSMRDAPPLRAGPNTCTLTQTGGRYLLYGAMQLFFQNGGGPCHVVSAGAYGSDVDAERLSAGVQALAREAGPTMLVVPEAVLLTRAACQRLQRQMLQHCGQVMKNCFAILDVWEGYRSRSDGPDVVADFRDGLGHDELGFGAAYYPWVHTTVVQAGELGCEHLADDGSLDTLIAGLQDEIAAAGLDGAARGTMAAEVDRIRTTTDAVERQQLNGRLARSSPFFAAVLAEMARRLNLLPPSAAMAGIYTMVDNTRGVWKAPANVGLAGVIGPAVTISQAQQEDLNVTPQGKSINAIRSFVGEGTLVWGARTLDGNSLDWRYINVRRTMIMLEESCRMAAKALVFEPNVDTTWATLRSMIGHFLTAIWKRGGLAGAVPDDAFSVHVGLGETMTPEDVLEGILRVTVLVAISRPAEFIEITFQQQMQTS
jgi:phage tail sheath protein FI